MRNFKINILISLIVFFPTYNASECVIPNKEVNDKIHNISMYSLLFDVKRFNNKHISFTGLLHIDMQGGISLWTTKQSLDNGIFIESVKLSLPEDSYVKIFKSLIQGENLYYDVVGKYKSIGGKLSGILSEISFLCKTPTLSEFKSANKNYQVLKWKKFNRLSKSK